VLGRTAAIWLGSEGRQEAGQDEGPRRMVSMMPVGIKSVKTLSYGKMRAYHVDEMACNRLAMSSE
jgi:hypothetical protein